MRTTHNLNLRRTLIALAAIAASLLMVLTTTVAPPAQAQSTPSGTTITVNTNVDEDNTDGDCSLREAIKAANTNRAADRCPAGSATAEDAIGFNLTSSPTTITLGSTLPNITGSAGLVIDGGADVTVSGNDAVRIFNVNSGAKLSLRNLTVAHGYFDGRFGGGGGILNSGHVTVSNSTFLQNSANHGGAIHNNSGTLTVTNSTFLGNSAGVSGGAIHNARHLTVTNSTFSQNTATNFAGGGIYHSGHIESASQLVSNSTLSQNGAPAGGGIFVTEGGAVELRNTIVASSTSGENCLTSRTTGGTITDGGYNIEDANTCRFSAANNSMPNTNPKFETDAAGNPVLKDNGGPTQTIALQSTSPALNRIPVGANGCGTTIIKDQRGAPRPQETGCEVGAFEQDIPGPPDAKDDPVSTKEDAPLDIDVLENDSDPNPADTLSVQSVTQPSNGEATINPDGTIDYHPEENYNGEDSFEYTISDGQGGTDTATVTLTVSAVNDAPSFELPANPNQTVSEDAGAQSVEGFAKNISAGPFNEATQKVSFTLSNDNTSLFSGQPQISSEGTLTYTPAPDANGEATVKVKATDDGGTANGGKDTSAEQTFTIEVSATNDAPKATDESYSVDEDQTLTVPDGSEDLLANASDIEGDALTAVQVQGPSHGQLALSPDGSFSYTPDADYYGEDSFTYKANDGSADSNVATVNITVNAVNDEPVGTTDLKETPENTPLVLSFNDLTNNDQTGAANESSQTLTIKEVKNPTHGTVKLENGQVTFTPDANYNGQASFEYTVCDNGEPEPRCSTQMATVNVTVSPVNSRPEAKDASFTMNEDGAPITIDFSELVSDVETSDANLTYNIVVGSLKPNQGTLSGTGHSRTFNSADNFNGTVTISYTVTDRGDPDNCSATTQGGGGGEEACEAAKTSEQKKVSITVAPVNDAPVAKNDRYRVKDNKGLYVPPSGVLKNDSDVDADQRLLTARMVSKPKHGRLVLREDGSFAYRPDKNYTGRDRFTYLVSDGEGGKDTATVILRVL